MIRIATRASPLALWQAEAVRVAIARAAPGEEVTLVLVRTQGDAITDRPIAAIGTNVFTTEVDRAVAEGRADAGVHSLKDLGTRLYEGLALCATVPRGPVEDALVASSARRLPQLPAGARVGTGSPRRKAMLLRVRPDLACVPLRGNVETRIAKVESGAIDAAILARAGIERLGLGAKITDVLATDLFLPAAGQGLIGVVARAEDARVRAVLAVMNDAPGFACGLAERAVLRRLQAGCHAPVGALAVVAGGRLDLRARVLALDGTSEAGARGEGPMSEAERIGDDVAEQILARGGKALLDSSRF